MLNISEYNFEEGATLLIDKPLEWTSFDVVSKIRNTLKIKKVGHAGTLDPLATGLLIVCTGKSTKKIDLIQAEEKEYIGSFTLGKTTPSYDLETPFDSEQPIHHLTETEIRAAAITFIGQISQLPPIYSAIKIAGKPAYIAARKGQEVAIQPRLITVREFEITSIQLPFVYFRIVCSKGTYIRSLAHDFGQVLAVGAHLSALKRTRIGSYDVRNAWQLPDLIEAIKENRKV
jgi:tRNA pseudouridine55 synthase